MQRNNVPVKRCGGVLGYRVRPPKLAHDRERVAIDLPGKVRADGLPGVTAVVAAEQAVGGKVQARMRERADDERRIPIPTQRGLAFARLRLDAEVLSAGAVIAIQSAVLRLRIDRIRVFRIDLRPETVTTLGDEPIRIGDTAQAARARRPADGIVVLRSAV